MTWTIYTRKSNLTQNPTTNSILVHEQFFLKFQRNRCLQTMRWSCRCLVARIKWNTGFPFIRGRPTNIIHLQILLRNSQNLKKISSWHEKKISVGGLDWKNVDKWERCFFFKNYKKAHRVRTKPSVDQSTSGLEEISFKNLFGEYWAFFSLFLINKNSLRN